jgi:hypothetical protein
MSATATVVGTALATVLLAASAGKLAGRDARTDVGLALVEGALAIMLLGPWLVLPSAVVVSGCTAAFLVHAAFDTGRRPCRCFGSRLPTTGRAGQLFRNGSLLGLALAYLGLVGLDGGARAMAPLDVAVGAAVGAFLVVAPWVLQWAAGPVEPRRAVRAAPVRVRSRIP